MALSERQAAELLGDNELVPAMELGIAEAKRLRDACLAEDIPATLHRDDHCKTGCAPKVTLLVREDDVPKLAHMLRRGWIAEVEKNGTLTPGTVRAAASGEPDPDAEPPCPACGVAAPLVEGECSGCGLTLG